MEAPVLLLNIDRSGLISVPSPSRAFPDLENFGLAGRLPARAARRSVHRAAQDEGRWTSKFVNDAANCGAAAAITQQNSRDSPGKPQTVWPPTRRWRHPSWHIIYQGEPSGKDQSHRRHRHQRQDDHDVSDSPYPQQIQTTLRNDRHGRDRRRRQQARSGNDDAGPDPDCRADGDDARPRAAGRVRSEDIGAMPWINTERQACILPGAGFTNLTGDHLDYHGNDGGATPPQRQILI